MGQRQASVRAGDGTDGITHLEVTCDVTPVYEAMMNDMWPRALQRLKVLIETGS